MLHLKWSSNILNCQVIVIFFYVICKTLGVLTNGKFSQ
uniref:Uncharacterized protein n=1 Tax=Rhizophora mucronata TaxID=61149 RepID=A0A2P2IH88_RHIMU